jgi:hypothetical protein
MEGIPKPNRRRTMKTLRPFHLIPLLGGLALGACQDDGPTGLEALPDDLTVEEELTLEVLSNPELTEVALALATTQESAAHRRGRMWSSGEDLTAQAENQFRKAEQAFAQGDLVRAMERHREARRLVAQAMQTAGGAWALQAQFERLESLPAMVQGDPEGFQDPQGFALQLGKLAEGARKAQQGGNRVQAAQMGVLGEQALRKREREHAGVLAEHPEVRVALGAEALELATELVGEGADEEQLDLLAVAEALQDRAETALADGYDRWAAHYAHLSTWWALKAVVLPGGVTDEDASGILELALGLRDGAEAALGTEPDEIQAALWAWAVRMLEAGEANQSNGTCRGLGALWQAAVIFSYLIPDSV